MGDMHDVHLSRLEMNQLLLLEALSLTGSITLAADALGLSQPAASHSLARLRRLLGDPLFVRTSRGMQPTAYGGTVAQTVRDSLELLRKGLDAGRKFEPATARRIFRIFTSEIGQLVFVPPLLDHLSSHAPGIRIEVRTMPERDRAAGLELGEVDMAIGHITSLPGGFHQRHLFDERYVCAVSRTNTRFSKGMSLRAFAESLHAVAESTGMAHDGVIDVELAKHGVVRRAGLRVPEFVTLPFLIRDSELVLTMPSMLADRLAPIVGLRVLDPPIAFPPFAVRVYWHERVHRDEGHRWLRDVLVRLFQPLGKRRAAAH